MSIMKTYRITMILVALTWTAAAMTTPIDSLYRRICSTPRADIGEVNRLLMLLDADGITDSLIQHDRHAPREGMMAATHLYMADYFYDRQADMTATIQAARRAEQAAYRAQDTLRIEEALAYQAVAASRMGQIDVALKATKEELRLDSLSGQRPNLARAYNTLAGLSLQAGRTDDARLYVRKAIEIERTLEDTSHLGVRYGLAAEIYAKTGELDRALDYALQAYAIDRKAGDRTKTARRLSQMADIYAQKGDHRQAERFYLRSIDSLRAADERKSLAINLKQLGQFYARQQRWKESRQALTECEQICRATGNYYTLQQTCRLMADVLAGENPTQAIAYLQEALQLTDSLHSQRAEDLAVELRKSQAEALAETTQQGAATASHPPLHILLLLTLTAAIGIVGALWWGIRHAAATKEKTKSLTDEQDLPIRENTRKTQMSTRDIQFLAQVSEIYDRHLSLGRLDIDELASEMCMSRSQFTRRMTALTGMAASNYFNRLRIEKACRLLKDTEKPVNIISEECGFEDPSYFGSFFKKTLHVTPMQYRIMPKTD